MFSAQRSDQLHSLLVSNVCVVSDTLIKTRKACGCAERGSNTKDLSQHHTKDDLFALSSLPSLYEVTNLLELLYYTTASR